jgi:hypothetical protein
MRVIIRVMPMSGCQAASWGRDGHKPVKASEFYDRLEGAGV